MTPTSDRQEFTRSWHDDGPHVAAYARRHVPATEVADVVAETFTQAWRRWNAVPQPPRAWLIGIARRIVMNHHRTARRRRALTDRLTLFDGAAPRAEIAGVSPFAREHALQALARLPESQREPLLLIAWDGLTVDETARVLGLKPGTVRVRVHRARAALEAHEHSTERTSS